MSLRALLVASLLGSGAFLAGAWVGDCHVEGYENKCLARWQQLRNPKYWWTEKTYWEEDRSGAKYAFGVGKVSGVGNPALRRGTAEARARAEVAKGAAGKTSVQINLAACEAISQYDLPCTGTLYALVRCPR